MFASDAMRFCQGYDTRCPFLLFSKYLPNVDFFWERILVSLKSEEVQKVSRRLFGEHITLTHSTTVPPEKCLGGPNNRTVYCLCLAAGLLKAKHVALKIMLISGC